MQVFLYINLVEETAYQQPVVVQVRQAFPALGILDMDARSDELLQHYALRLLQEAEQAVVCIKADDATGQLNNLMPLLEELFQERLQRLVLLQGQHPRLQRIFAARPQVLFKVVEEEQVVEELKDFLINTPV
ncbi:hypothetical protein [Pontibacter rugosus]|uniref:Uncharacterized protein n=1 Tax=Pontibacter rugosus TaxID=1745966 RepID=A0ABW3SJ49_9BACT